MEDSLEQKVLKALLKKDVYTSVCVNKEIFSDKIHKLLNCIEELHNKYTTDLDIDTVKVHYNTISSESMTRKELVNSILDSIKTVEVPDTTQILDIVNTMSAMEDKRKLIALAFDTKTTKQDILEYVNSWSSVVDVPDKGVTETDLDCLVSHVDPKNNIPFALPTLQEATTGVPRGNHIAVFARTNVGKSTFMTHNAAHFISSGYKVLYIANEDNGKKLMLRVAQAVFGCEVEYIRQNKDKEEFKSEWKQVKDNIVMIYDPSIDMSQVSRLVNKHKPDVCILDQIDNISYRGGLSKEVNHLGLLWREARRMAGENNCAVFSVTQASAEAVGKQYLTETMCADSKTDKAAALDMLLGIGICNGDESRRCINIIKNKVNDNHTAVFCSIDSKSARFLP